MTTVAVPPPASTSLWGGARVRASMPIRRFRLPAALTAAVVVLGAGAAPPATAAADPYVTPSCDAIQGVTEALGDRWRVFWDREITEEDNAAGLFACRRAPGPAAAVIPLGVKTVTETSCECTDVQGIDGDRVLLRNTSTGPGSSTHVYVLYDLRRRTVARLGDRAGAPSVELLPGGGLLSGPYGVGATVGTSPTVVDDVRGRTVVSDAGVDGIARSSDGSVVYATRADGIPVRVSGGGAAPLEWSHTSALRTQRSDWRVRRSSSRVTAIGHDGVTDLNVVVEGRGSRARRSIEAFGRRVPLRASGAVTLLAMSPDLAVIRAPFAGTDGRPVRVLRSTSRATKPQPSGLPADPPLLATASRGVLAWASADAVTVDGPSPARFEAAGARDLAIATMRTGTQVYERLYVTDASGTVRSFATAVRTD